VDEALNNGTIVGPPNENRSISGFGEGACEYQLSTPMGVPSER
jgi:hypothetical protein